MHVKMPVSKVLGLNRIESVESVPQFKICLMGADAGKLETFSTSTPVIVIPKPATVRQRGCHDFLFHFQNSAF